MKKQIFILVFLVLTTFANVGNSFGQVIHGSNPKTLTCDVSDPLFPVAGRSYDYSATFNPDGGTAYWYATKSTNIISNLGGRIASVEAISGTVVAAGTAYATNLTPTLGASTTSITWKSSGFVGVAPASPLLVVVEYQATSPNCANNLKVFNIEPKNAFTIDIRNMLSDGTYPSGVPTAYGTNTVQCADVIESATYNTTSFSMNMDYGDQTLYYEVIAANFTGSFTPSFKISGLSPGQTAEIFWGDKVATATTSLGAISNGVPKVGTSVSTAATNTQFGVSIYVKVVIQNNKVENTTGEIINLAVDAINAENQDDVLETNCTTNAAYADIASQNITFRPTTTPVAPLTVIAEN